MVVLCSSSVNLDYDLRISHQCGKKVKTKSQNVFGVNSYICWKYRGKAGKGFLFAPPPPHPFVWCFEKALGFQKDSETNFASQFYWQSKGQEKNQNQHKCYFGPNLHLAFTFQNSFQHDIDILLYQNYFPQKMFSRSGNVL